MRKSDYPDYVLYNRSSLLSDSVNTNSIKRKRKILLDCGGNIASTVELFRETYPGGHEFLIHSFEMDPSLAPYYAPYSDVVLHNPVAVSNKDGWTVSYLETTWFPERGLRKTKDWMMGGGSLFPYEDEKKDNITGGARNLARHIRVKTIDFSRWIREHINEEDYVIFKLDVEGAEYDILQQMVHDGTFKLIDKFYGETHFWHPTGWSASKRQELMKKVRMTGFTQTYWAGEERTYADFDALHPFQNQLYPYGVFEMQNINITRQSVVSSEMRLNEVGIPVLYYLPVTVQDRIKTVAENRKLRIIVPTVTFPPKDEILTWENYYQHHDVARVPKALRLIDNQLKESGGILSLDSDNPDSVMISVFLMDYLVEKSQFEIVSLGKCF
ncbi:PREDICTED: uncharacterized protein LOC109470488 [Branchiostoma belcheri]|uniref:Uncharacterized protein LOC109470488 n=1 Tax=Branchiostoma belcheri TaxID=7741 RepID=A0A6P4Z1Q5_BRABE|nr:PREDICTED: uncharacterized protein LOC109470488 [Branchiostoma belcheri]